MKKNNFKSLAAVLSLAMAATAVPVNANAAAAPKLTVSDTTVYSGRTYSMTVKNLKKGYTVQFSSNTGDVKFNSKKVKATGAKVSNKFTVKAAKSIANNSKTKIKAVVKNANGKKVKSLTKQVTLKQLAKSLTVKDIEQTTIKVGDTVNADATIAPKAAKGAYTKVFSSSDSDVLEVINASNGEFRAVAPGTATIQVSASNGGETISGSQTIEITVEAAADEPATTPGTDTPTTPGDTTPATTPTGSAILNDYELTLSLRDNKSQITANGVDQAIVDVTLAPPTEFESLEGIGDMKVAVDLVLGTANIGSLSQNRLTLTYDNDTKKWTGYVVFTSATLNNPMTSSITASVATVIDVPVAASGKQLDGLAAKEALQISLVPAATEQIDIGVVADATKAVVESCDRMIITFSRTITPDEFFKTNTTEIDPNKFDLFVEPNASDNQKDTNIDINTKNEYWYTSKVAGILPVSGHGDQLEFVFVAGAELPDNSRFFARFVNKSNGTSTPSRVLSDRIVDTSVPTVMDVTADRMNAIIVKFDQPVVHYLQNENGANVEDIISPSDFDTKNPNPVVSALAHLNFAIDGYNLADNEVNEYTETKSDGKKYSLFGKNVTIAPEHGLYRDTIKITLGTATANENSNQRCYLGSGNHILQIFNVGDYASLTDTKNNKIATQTFTFTVAANSETPNWEVEQQSVEQFIIKFTAPISKLDKYKVGETVTDLPIELEYNDTKDTANPWKSLSAGNDAADFAGIDPNGNASDDATKRQGIKITRIPDTTDGLPRVKVEVTQDWTNLLGYVKDRKSYISHDFRLFMKENSVQNLYNGKFNGNLQQRLDKLKEYDGTSPEIESITEVPVDEGKTRVYMFDVKFTEPVQAGNAVFQNLDTSTFTPGFNSVTMKPETLGTMSVEIVNTTTKKVYSTDIIGYTEDLEDKTIRVRVNNAQNETEFPAGDYTLYARYVSDDAGNTVSTKAQPFNYGGQAAIGFKVLSVLADKGNKGVSLGNQVDNLTNLDDYDKTHDYIYVEFSDNYSTDVLVQNNWTLNGVALPVGSYIEAGIIGSGIENDRRCITIVLPDDYLTDINRTNLRINGNVKGLASDGTATASLQGQTTFNTPAIFVGSAFYNKSNLYVQDTNGVSTLINGTATELENK